MCRAEKVCWIITLICAVFVIGPFVAEDLFEPLGDARFAGVMVGLLVGITSAIVSGLFKARGRARARLLKGIGLLAHWTYSEDEWQSYVREDIVRERSLKWKLFGIVAFWCVLFAILFPIFDNEDGWWVTVVMLGLMAVIVFAIIVGTRMRQGRLRSHAGEVRIAEDALWLTGELHVWKGWGARLEGVEVVDGTPPCLAVVYSTPSRAGRDTQSVRVPIPSGKDNEAAEVAVRLLAQVPGRT
jgi:hypothetical protein